MAFKPNRLPYGRGFGRGNVVQRGSIQGASATLLSGGSVCSSETRGDEQTYNRLVNAKQIYQGATFQDDQPRVSKSCNLHAMLGDVSGHKGCLFARSNKEVPTQIFGIPSKGSALLLQGNAFRLVPSSLGVHKVSSLSSFSFEREGNPCSSLSRRLDNLGEGQGQSSEGVSDGNSGAVRTWLCYKPWEVGANSQARCGLVGSQVEHPAGIMVSSRPIYSRNVRMHTEVAEGSQGIKETVGTADGKAGLCLSDHSKRPTALPRFGQTAASSGKDSGRVGAYSARAEKCSKAVVGWLSPSRDESSEACPTRAHLVDGCVDNGVGSSVVSGPQGGRAVVGCRKKYAHQLLRAIGRTQRAAEFGLAGEGGDNCHRQCSDSGSDSEARLEEQTDSGNSKAALLLGMGASHTSVVYSNSGGGQCSGRRSVEGSPSGVRVGTPTGRVSEVTESDQASPGRLVCFAPEQQTATVCVCVSSSQGAGSGCVHAGVERVEEYLSIPSNKAPGKSDRAIKIVQVRRTNCSPKKGKRPVVSLSARKRGRGRPARASRAASARQNHKGTVLLLRRMDRIHFLESVFRRRFSEVVSKFLGASYRPSSIRQAEVAWKTFQEWLPGSATQISKSTVLSFLSFLFVEKGLSPRTVMCYRASLALPLKVGFGINTADQEFSLLAKAQFLARPPVKKLVPRWSIAEALQALKKPRFKSKNICYKDLFLKTLFLVALASGNRVSELAALDRSSASFHRNYAAVSFSVRPGFLFKNQGIDRSPPNIFFPGLEADKVLCPVRAVSAYLKHQGNQSEEARVFVNPDTGRSLNASGLAMWLCRAIITLVPGARPRAHDMRKYAFSLAWARGIPMPDIISKGFWTSSNVFINKYLVETPRGLACVAGASLE